MFVNNNYHLSFTINNSWFHYRLTDINYVANYLPVVYASLFIFCTWTLFSIVKTSFTKWHFHLTLDPIYTHLSKSPPVFLKFRFHRFWDKMQKLSDRRKFWETSFLKKKNQKRFRYFNDQTHISEYRFYLSDNLPHISKWPAIAIFGSLS